VADAEEEPMMSEQRLSFDKNSASDSKTSSRDALVPLIVVLLTVGIFSVLFHWRRARRVQEASKPKPEHPIHRIVRESMYENFGIDIHLLPAEERNALLVVSCDTQPLGEEEMRKAIAEHYRSIRAVQTIED
jgi:hypothetical protein